MLVISFVEGIVFNGTESELVRLAIIIINWSKLIWLQQTEQKSKINFTLLDLTASKILKNDQKYFYLSICRRTRKVWPGLSLCSYVKLFCHSSYKQPWEMSIFFPWKFLLFYFTFLKILKTGAYRDGLNGAMAPNFWTMLYSWARRLMIQLITICPDVPMLRLIKSVMSHSIL